MPSVSDLVLNDIVWSLILWIVTLPIILGIWLGLSWRIVSLHRIGQSESRRVWPLRVKVAVAAVASPLIYLAGLLALQVVTYALRGFQL